MKIAYSVAGEGLGHAARMVCLVPRLAQEHEVELFCPVTVQDYVRERLPGRKIRDVPHFSFVKKGDRVLFLATLVTAIRRLPAFIREVFRLVKLLKTESFDAVVSDFDPYLAWAGRLAGLRVVQINHPGVVLRNLSFNPLSWPAVLAAFLLEGPWNRRILCSFYGGDVGPLLRPELLAKPRRDSGSWVCHLKPEYHDLVVPALEKAGLVPYDLYPRKGGDFDAALVSARGVISSAGHQIISEALVLGKPILVLPQSGQYEQILNARQLERTGRGWKATRKNLESRLRGFRFWAETLDKKSPYRDDTETAVTLLLAHLGKAPVRLRTSSSSRNVAKAMARSS
jgi:hypothetical protein